MTSSVATRMPVRMIGQASGSSTRSSRCVVFSPIPLADSMTASVDVLEPVTVLRRIGRIEYIVSAMIGPRSPTPMRGIEMKIANRCERRDRQHDRARARAPGHGVRALRWTMTPSTTEMTIGEGHRHHDELRGLDDALEDRGPPLGVGHPRPPGLVGVGVEDERGQFDDAVPHHAEAFEQIVVRCRVGDEEPPDRAGAGTVRAIPRRPRGGAAGKRGPGVVGADGRPTTSLMVRRTASRWASTGSS